MEAAVIGGRQRWRARIEGLAKDLQNKFDELAEEEEARAAIIKRTAEDLQAFAAYALPLIDAVASENLRFVHIDGVVRQGSAAQ